MIDLLPAADPPPANRIALLDERSGIWVTFHAPWWDLLSWIWWWLTPGPKQFVQLNRPGGWVVVRAARVADQYIRIGNGGGVA